jgi:hypothetical protein
VLERTREGEQGPAEALVSAQTGGLGKVKYLCSLFPACFPSKQEVSALLSEQIVDFYVRKHPKYLPLRSLLPSFCSVWANKAACAEIKLDYLKGTSSCRFRINESHEQKRPPENIWPSLHAS